MGLKCAFSMNQTLQGGTTMKKALLIFLLSIIVALLLSGCGEKRIVHCDHCGGEIKVDVDSNVTEDWILYCDPCNEELFGDDPLLGNG